MALQVMQYMPLKQPHCHCSPMKIQLVPTKKIPQRRSTSWSCMDLCCWPVLHHENIIKDIMSSYCLTLSRSRQRNCLLLQIPENEKASLRKTKSVQPHKVMKCTERVWTFKTKANWERTKGCKVKWEIHRANVENKSENAVSTTRGWNWDKKRSSLQKPGSRQDDKVMTNNIIRSLKLQWQDAEHILDYIQKAYSDEVASVLAIRTVIVVRVSAHFVVSSHI